MTVACLLILRSGWGRDSGWREAQERLGTLANNFYEPRRASLIHGWAIFEQETTRAGTMPPLAFSVTMVGPVIYTFGNEAQKKKFLPRILSGKDWWCQGYSEPGSGFDLATVRTKAVRDGDHYIVNGHKTWTTLAQHADWIFCLVRTDTSAKPQAGISFILVDMKSPGVTVRPIITIDGSHEVNDVFLEDVRVPVENLSVRKTGAGLTQNSCSEMSVPVWPASAARRATSRS